MRIEANVGQMQTWLNSLKTQVEELALERDEAREFCRRMREFLRLRGDYSPRQKERFNAVCHDLSAADWFSNAEENPYLPLEDAERLRKLEAGPG
jgi:chromosome segregation ATPase